MKRWQFWLGVIISAGFLYLALRGLHLDEVWGTIRQANFIWIFPGVVIYFVGVWVRAWRWKFMLRPIKNIPIKTMFHVVCIGYMGNNIYPARAGEVLRAVVLKKREGVPISASLATVIVERIFDGVVMLGFVILNLPGLTKQISDNTVVDRIHALTLWGSLAFLGALAVFLLAAMFPARGELVANFFIGHLVPQRWREKILAIVQRFLTGLEFLRSPQEVLLIFFSSILIWLLETGKYWFVMLAFPFQISFLALMLVNGVINLATMIPSAPGYIGTFDALGIALLKAYHVAGEIAAGYTLLLHVALWLPITALGAYYFAREGLSWDSAQRQKLAEE